MRLKIKKNIHDINFCINSLHKVNYCLVVKMVLDYNQRIILHSIIKLLLQVGLIEIKEKITRVDIPSYCLED